MGDNSINIFMINQKVHPVIQYISNAHSEVTTLLEELFGIPVDKLFVRIEDWDTQKTLDSVNGNSITSKLIANLHKKPSDIKRINNCLTEIQKNNSWLHPIVLLELSTIPWPKLNSRVPIKKCPFDGDYFLLDGSHRCKALLSLITEDSRFWKSMNHKVAIAYM